MPTREKQDHAQHGTNAGSIQENMILSSRQSYGSHMAWLEEQIAKLQAEINDPIDGHPELKQDAELMTRIPGIGEATVAKVLAYAGDVRCFANAKALAAFTWNMSASAAVGELGQGTHDDLTYRPCSVAQSLVHARAGGAAPQPDPASLWRKDESKRPSAESGGGRSNAQTGASDLWGGEIRQAV
jgi:hypothetical protein